MHIKEISYTVVVSKGYQENLKWYCCDPKNSNVELLEDQVVALLHCYLTKNETKNYYFVLVWK